MTALPYGDPTQWDEIPEAWLTAFTHALQAHGHTIDDAHESAITIAAPGLDDGEEWSLVKPNFHGLWAHGIYIRGYCPDPEWIHADAADPQAVADVVHAILTGAPLKRTFLNGAMGVYPAPTTEA
ncbi:MULTISPECIES: hypothetical protein [Streptomyces]|uniref:DUF317 domain-containing protein n=1 Tax=Streptomyces tsukubensis (strain DSM 42081 / NBRC 108919 / NRRL 18488 / 9993) TaxID=1114943 RepID=I2N0W7_STRT9|nr:MULTISPECIES: hypothetical protein [Streptomyces]AZK94851.1 hypothetical protein B7R87_13975 [Streptomyces tsukubensis]EIF90664.1 hypothetical protein [Streptomyces tsukubensis NRRL18488]MYS66979.1 hypothetical protein [Streptomyces sp. SID5473]QKM69066.1 hypothetical protein STSU_019795 [Streptomyces tsukubensis NRRL18488]TAI40711.1 hypothetical protein EWI31_30440 [Streptomyces tsukubensis]